LHAMQALSQLSYTPKISLAYTKEKPLHIKDLQGF